MSSWIKKIGDRTREALVPGKKAQQPDHIAAADDEPVDASALDFGDGHDAGTKDKPGSLIAQLAGLNPNESAFLDAGYDPQRGPQNLLREIEDSVDAGVAGGPMPPHAETGDAASSSLIARYSQAAESIETAGSPDSEPESGAKAEPRASRGYRELSLEFDDEFGAVAPPAARSHQSAHTPDEEDSIERSLSTVKLDVADLDLGAASGAQPVANDAGSEDSIERDLATVKLDVADLDIGFAQDDARSTASESSPESGEVPLPEAASAARNDPSALQEVTDPELSPVAATGVVPKAVETERLEAGELATESGPADAFPAHPPANRPPVAQQGVSAQSESGADNLSIGTAGDDDATQIGLSPESTQDTVTGWLVVVDGPGKGLSRSLGVGINAVGRAPDNRVPLYLGGRSDGEISRRDHVRVIYDPKGNCFSVQHGSSRNLSYLNDKPIYETVTLNAHDRITIGKTTLLFVPLCGDGFKW